MSKNSDHFSRGQGIIEFALVLILFLIVTLVIFDLGRAVIYYSVLNNAAREGARYGVTDPNAYKIQSVVRGKVNGLQVNPQISFQNGDVTVAIDYPFTPVTPVLGMLMSSDGIILHSQSTMTIEQ